MGVKLPLGSWRGLDENATLSRTLLADLVDRAFGREQAIMFVIDGAKAVSSDLAVSASTRASIAAARHKERIISDLLPESYLDQARAQVQSRSR